jgi:hypothetical protein
MLRERRTCLRGGRLKAGRLLKGLRTWLTHGEPELRPTAPVEGRRQTGSIEPKVSFSLIGLSIRLGVDELAKLPGATLPKRKGGSGVSALLGRCWGMLLVEKGLERERVGRLEERLRLRRMLADCCRGEGETSDLLRQLQEARCICGRGGEVFRRRQEIVGLLIRGYHLHGRRRGKGDLVDEVRLLVGKRRDVHVIDARRRRRHGRGGAFNVHWRGAHVVFRKVSLAMLSTEAIGTYTFRPWEE